MYIYICTYIYIHIYIYIYIYIYRIVKWKTTTSLLKNISRFVFYIYIYIFKFKATHFFLQIFRCLYEIFYSGYIFIYIYIYIYAYIYINLTYIDIWYYFAELFWVITSSKRRSSSLEVFCKRDARKNLHSSQENTCARSLS